MASCSDKIKADSEQRRFEEGDCEFPPQADYLLNMDEEGEDYDEDDHDDVEMPLLQLDRSTAFSSSQPSSFSHLLLSHHLSYTHQKKSHPEQEKLRVRRRQYPRIIHETHQKQSFRVRGSNKLVGGRVQYVMELKEKDGPGKCLLGLLMMISMALSVVLFSAMLDGRLGWRALQSYELKDEFGYKDISNFLRASDVSLSVALSLLLSHMALSIMSLRWRLHMKDLNIGAAVIFIILLIFSSVLTYIMSGFLTVLREDSGNHGESLTGIDGGGYCAAGYNEKNNPGCDDMIDGFTMSLHVGAGLLITECTSPPSPRLQSR
eukprot:jgi/Bigna1/130530/aug1.11_g5238